MKQKQKEIQREERKGKKLNAKERRKKNKERKEQKQQINIQEEKQTHNIVVRKITFHFVNGHQQLHHFHQNHTDSLDHCHLSRKLDRSTEHQEEEELQ